MSDGDNTPYALPTGQIGLNEIHVEAGGTSGTQCSMNDADIRGIIGKASGTQSRMGEWHGASASLSFSHLGTDINANGSEFDFGLDGSSVTADDRIVVCGGVEGFGGLNLEFQSYQLNGNDVTAHVSTAYSITDSTSVYVGSRVATGSLIGSNPLSVSSGGSLGTRGGCAVFGLVNGSRATALQSKTTSEGQGSPAQLVMTATPDDIIFVSAFTDYGFVSSMTITTSNGSLSRYNGVSSQVGSGAFAVVTGATNPVITLANTTSGSAPKCGMGVTVFGQ